ncbi:MAG: prepilin-type N-terminal cleavage/methylation domain-containing protein [Cyanobacteria bacterium]|jgi:prepilin-type N-terminal cleavage/methylation domain-containing protein|nr:prepilin-type N-terminal cleavage/methylation domain-containing protein [Cyanobacteria bacterium GSL.Bin21]
MLTARHQPIAIPNQRTNKGFTLVELLASLVITGIVVASLNIGMTYLLQESRETEKESQRRSEHNRAADFLTEEMRMAKAVAMDSTISTATDAPSFTKDCTDTSDDLVCVLILQVPGVPERIIYYTEPAATPWQGPRVLRRWGPNFCADGTYSKLSSLESAASSGDNSVTVPSPSCNFASSDTVRIGSAGTYTISSVSTASGVTTLTLGSNLSQDVSIGDPVGAVSTWSGNVLADSIADTVPPPKCKANETLNGNEGYNGGVYACVQNDEREATVTLVGSLEETSSENYTVRARAFTRSN